MQKSNTLPSFLKLRIILQILFFLVTGAIVLQSQNQSAIMSNSKLTFQEKVARIEKIYQSKTKGKHSGYKQFERWKYLAEGRLTNDGYVITGEEMANSLAEFRKVEDKLKSIPQSHNWQPKGPIETIRTSSWSSHIGRITSLSVSSMDEDHLIVGSPGGGVWKSLDGGLNLSLIHI